MCMDVYIGKYRWGMLWRQRMHVMYRYKSQARCVVFFLERLFLRAFENKIGCNSSLDQVTTNFLQIL